MRFEPLQICVIIFAFAVVAIAQPLKYVAVITQEFEQEPSVTVLENEIGRPIAWHRQGTGDYRGVLAGAFPQGRVVAFVGRSSAYVVGFYSLNRFSDDVVQLSTSGLWWNGEELLIEPTDTLLSETPVTITVYPKKTR